MTYRSCLATIDRANTQAVDGGNAGIFRNSSELLVLDATPGGNNARAEECFLEALRVSQTQGTLFWEFRASIGLARLRAGSFQTIIEPIFSRFTDRYEGPDLRVAASILQSGSD